jgi:hypothetical protein
LEIRHVIPLDGPPRSSAGSLAPPESGLRSDGVHSAALPGGSLEVAKHGGLQALMVVGDHKLHWQDAPTPPSVFLLATPAIALARSVVVSHVKTANALLEGGYRPAYAEALAAVISWWAEIGPVVFFHLHDSFRVCRLPLPQSSAAFA